MKYLLFIISIFIFNGCFTSAHQDFIKNMNSQIGHKVAIDVKPFKYKWAGQMFRGDFVKSSIGLTHITYDKNGNIVRHWYGQEVLPNGPKKMIGKCLTYQVINSKNGTIIQWGFDKGGNPISCVLWWQ